MARRVLNRKELRKAADEAERQNTGEATAEAPKKKKAAGEGKTPAVRKPRKKKAPPRMCARWAVFDAGMKQLAVFDYNRRADADQKIADLKARKNGVYFVQIVKEPMPEPEPVTE